MDRWVCKSAVLGAKACVASNQPIVSKIGFDILLKGGNAADAAVAMAVAVSVTEPFLCGLGGDSNCLFYKASDRSVLAVNGCGRSASNLTLQKVKDDGFTAEKIVRSNNGLFINVPGAVGGMFDCIRHFGSGKLTMKQLFDPAIRMCETGVPLPFKTVKDWTTKSFLVKSSLYAGDIIGGSSYKDPEVGDIITNPRLSASLKTLAAEGLKSFYCGETAKKIVNEVQSVGGLLTLDDMAYHMNALQPSPSMPLFFDFHEYRVWEMGPNTTGLIVLVILNILQGYDLKALGHNSAEYIHLVSEAIRMGFCHTMKYICDPSLTDESYKELLSEKYAEKCRKLISSERRNPDICVEDKPLLTGGNTSYVTAVDCDGNACSFILSISSGFGSGCVPKDCGFILNDRGKCFSFNEKSKNVFGPGKLALNTIIPGMVTDKTTGDLIASFGVIGRWMQPQGQVQVLLNMIIFGMDPQVAVDQPRFFVGEHTEYMKILNTLDKLTLEGGISPSVVSTLKAKNYEKIVFVSESARRMFGYGHVIAKQCLWNKESKSEVLWSGTDIRCDGCGLAY